MARDSPAATRSSSGSSASTSAGVGVRPPKRRSGGRRSRARPSSRAAGRRSSARARRSGRRAVAGARDRRARRHRSASISARSTGSRRRRRATAAIASAGRPASGWPSTAPGTPVLVEYFGWILISGRIVWTACATAIAASAKPVAISLSLPSKVVMSPQAQTRSSEVFITGSTTIAPLLDLEAPLLERPERGLEAELEQDRVDLDLDLVRLVLGVEQRDPLDAAVAEHVLDLERHVQRRRRRARRPPCTWPTVTSWARKPSRRCTSVISLGGVEQVDDPVAGRVAAADDHHALAGEHRLLADEVVGAAALPRRHVVARQLLRLERAVAAGDDHACASAARPGRCAGRRRVLVLPQEMRSAVVSRCTGTSNCSTACSRSSSTRSLASDLRVAGHVEDPLLRVERRELAADLGQRVDDPRASASRMPAQNAVVRPTGPAPITVMSRISSKSCGRACGVVDHALSGCQRSTRQRLAVERAERPLDRARRCR